MEVVEQEVLDFAERWAEAIVSNDAAAIGSFISDDWIIVGENGTTNKPDFLAWVESGDLTHERMEMVGEARIQIYGDTAVLTARVTNNGHYKNQSFSADEWTTDVFRRLENRWSCVLSHVTPARDIKIT
ncbi:MAG: nuclear transport factor 2 family protein [Acidobacteriota bacterium]|nr:nuclear transport factor 2 family protein [Acidobacteriota bacterium]